MLQDEFPEIAQIWDYEKNHIDLTKITKGSHKKVWWKCLQGHSYQMSILKRCSSKNLFSCPICSGHKILKGFNDLQSKFPDIAEEWNKTLNLIGPDKITAFSNKKVWWTCKKNHVYQAKVIHRTSMNSGCPVCSGRKILKGFNDLLTLKPVLCKEWDYELNSKEYNLSPDEVTVYSTKYAYWKCKLGHSWKAKIQNRTSLNQGCPKCCLKQTSKHEQILFDELNHIYQCENRKKHKINDKLYETDIFIPELNLGIEFNGLYWHKDKKEKDKLKETKLSIKIKMIYVIEGTENKIIDNKIYFDCKHKYEDNFTWAKNQLKEIIKNGTY